MVISPTGFGFGSNFLGEFQILHADHFGVNLLQLLNDDSPIIQFSFFYSFLIKLHLFDEGQELFLFAFI